MDEVFHPTAKEIALLITTNAIFGDREKDCFCYYLVQMKSTGQFIDLGENLSRMSDNYCSSIRIH